MLYIANDLFTYQLRNLHIKNLLLNSSLFIRFPLLYGFTECFSVKYSNKAVIKLLITLRINTVDFHRINIIHRFSMQNFSLHTWFWHRYYKGTEILNIGMVPINMCGRNFSFLSSSRSFQALYQIIYLLYPIANSVHMSKSGLNK